MDKIIVLARGQKPRVMRSDCYIVEVYEAGPLRDDLHDLARVDLEGELHDMIPAMMIVERASMRIMAIMDTLQAAIDESGTRFDVRKTIMDALQEDLKKETENA